VGIRFKYKETGYAIGAIAQYYGETPSQYVARALWASTHGKSLREAKPYDLSIGILYTPDLMDDYQAISSFCDELSKRGVPTGIFASPLISKNPTELKPPRLLIVYTVMNRLRPYVRYLEAKTAVANPSFSYEVGGNRFLFWREVESLDIPKPETWFLESLDKLVVFLKYRGGLAVKEWLHRGGGTTTVRFDGWRENSIYTFRRFDFEWPVVAQKWLPHNPREDYLRVLNVGGVVMGARPKEASDIVHGQESRSFEKHYVPRRVARYTDEILSLFKATYGTFDVVRSNREYYVVDAHFNHTDIFDQYMLTPKTFTRAWLKVYEEVS